MSLHQRIYTLVIVPILGLFLTFILIHAFGSHAESTEISRLSIVGALAATFGRLLVAYVFALLFSLPLALLVTRNAFAERVFLPLFDVIQSLPMLAFFPVVIVFFVHFGMYNGAAIFILFTAMLWNIVFSLVSGLHSIPAEIKAAGHIFGLHGLAFARKILVPASVPYLITGSILAFAQGWNIVIVAEVLHTYLPGSTTAIDLYGIGSVLVHASADGQQQTFLAAILALVVVIALCNFFIWQKLLHHAEKYKFE